MTIAMRVGLGVVLAAGWMGHGKVAQQKAGGLDAVLKQMDEGSKKFKNAEAAVRRENYERVVKDTTVQTGTIYFLREGKTTQMGAVFQPPSPLTIEFKGGVFRMFNPGTDQMTLINAKANQARYESLLTIGFGGSGSELESKWTITDLGVEAVAGVATRKLDLVAKDADVLKMFKHVTVWVDPVRDISLKQFSETPDGDSQTVYYTDIKYNEKVDLGKFAFKTDKKTTVVQR